MRKVRGSAHTLHACSGSHAQHAQRDSTRMGCWSAAQKVDLVRLVREHNPCGAADWEVRLCPALQHEWAMSACSLALHA